MVTDPASIALANLRQRLLDLSNRNRLLNFAFSDRSRTHVRIVDEVPNVLWGKINEGSSLTFRPLPEKDEDDKESTGKFLLNLETARLEDEEYIHSLDEIDPEDIASALSQKIERALRDRVRAQMGLPPLVNRETMSPAEYAEAMGFNPLYDLPAEIDDEDPEKHEDNEIQTLLFPDQLERKLSGIRDGARTALAEMGLNTLYTAFGYLEWYESDHTDRKFLAPLILFPVEMQRTLRHHTYRYSINTLGEEPEVNITLKERLKLDFGFVLPDLEEIQTPEDYFSLINQAIEPFKRWRLRRFVVVGLFSFGRLPMYQDLNPERWPTDLALEHNPNVRRLLRGPDAPQDQAPREREYDVDQPEIEKQVPVLITDADSSQFAAIADVMRGTNLALKGPPGTGKSQTITNLIAAAMAKGKRVLFVAEKMAALEVVKKRLDDAGIGEFCLEIHSTKARKKDVLKSIEHRLESFDRGDARHLARVKTDFERTRNRLSDYVQKINSAYGEMGRSLHEIIWQTIQADDRRHCLGLPDSLDDLEIGSARDLTDEQFESWRSHTVLVESEAQPIISQFGHQENHPWRFVKRSNLSPFEQKTLKDSVASWTLAVERLIDTSVRLGDQLGSQDSWSADGLSHLCTQLLSLRDVPEACGRELLTRIRDTRDLSTLKEAVATAQQIHRDLTELGKVVEVDQAISGLEESAEPLVAAVESLLTDKSLRDAPLSTFCCRARQYEEAANTVLAIEQELKDLLPLFGIPAPLTVESVFCLDTGLRLLNATEKSVLQNRTPYLVERSSVQEIASVSAALQALRSQQSTLLETFSLTLEEEPSDLASKARAIRSASLLSRILGKEYRQAKSYWRGIRKSRIKLSDYAVAEELEAIARFLTDRRKLRDDERIADICGRQDVDLALEDIERYALVVCYAKRVKSETLHHSTAHIRIRQTLLSAEIDTIDMIRQVADTALMEHLARFVSSLKESGWDRKPETTLASVAQYYRVSIMQYTELVRFADKFAFSNDIELWQIPKVVKSLKELRSATMAVQSNPELHRLLGQETYDIPNTFTALIPGLSVCERIFSLDISLDARKSLISMYKFGGLAPLWNLCVEIEELLSQEARAREKVAELSDDGEFDPFGEGQPVKESALCTIANGLRALLSETSGLESWLRLSRAVSKAKSVGLTFLLEYFDSEHLPYVHLDAALVCAVFRSLLRFAYQEEFDSLSVSGVTLNKLRHEFKVTDKAYIQAMRRQLRAELLNRQIPEGSNSGPKREWTDMHLISNELNKKQRHIPLRDLIGRASGALQVMKPCWMMSPLSVAQFLAPLDVEFDLVMIDEASQMRPEEALGAIARSGQVVVVGDPQQLPPSSFFEKIETYEADDEDWEEYVDNESILDLALASYRPSRTLQWHYRSRHESLIAFSNYHFYENRLVVFPSPVKVANDLGVEYRRVAGIYTPKASVNIPEALEVAKAAVEFMCKNRERSLGIVTMNQAQRDLLMEHMDREFAFSPEAEKFRAHWENTLEPFFVKNLENVQGDERDVIFISTVYGPEQSGGRVARRFGPVNSMAGHRRLNVLFTRAKQKVVVFSSMGPEDVLPSETSKKGVWTLKNYLSYANGGQLDPGVQTSREADSDFEIFVGQELQKRGYAVAHQVGVAGYFIDLAVRHPSDPDRFVLGVECDGANYHSAKSVRDRDRLREEVLESLGWKIYRVWSTDWFSDTELELASLLNAIRSSIE